MRLRRDRRPRVLAGAATCVLALPLAAAYYCHRFFGVDFALEGDAALQVYFQLNRDLILSDHNPFQWGYASFMPFAGLYSPVVTTTRLAVDSLAPGAPEIVRALGINMLSSWLGLSLLSVGVFALFRVDGRSRLASTLGALIVPYTGFHLAGVGGFDHMYLVSFMGVAPALLCVLKLSEGQRVLGFTAGAALCIGLSLLGGSNVPMFYYVPFFFLVPVLRYRLDRKLKALLRSFGWLASAVGVGLIVAAPVLVPGILFLGQTNRTRLAFDGGNNPGATFITLFLRDWWRVFSLNYHEVDFFVGLPVLVLLVVGIRHALRNDIWLDPTAQTPGPRFVLTPFMLVCLLAGLVVSHHSSLPGVIARPLARFYELQSIRHAARFFLLALLPIAYFAAVGFDAFTDRFARRMAGLLAAWNVALIAIVLVPFWPYALPDTRLAAVLSLTCAFLATTLLVLRPVFGGPASGIAVAMVFGMYLFGPQQLTMYGGRYLRYSSGAEGARERLTPANVLALTAHYDRAVAAAAGLLLAPPPPLEPPETRVGRIYDVQTVPRKHYYAPRTGHHFAFDAVDDPASSGWVRELFDIKTDPILDLYGVCWVLDAVPSPRPFGGVSSISYSDPRLTPRLRRRPGCFPEVFTVPHIRCAGSDAAVLEQMRHASGRDFLDRVLVNCAGGRGADLASAREETPALGASRPVRVIAERPGRLSFEVGPGPEAVLFLSTEYHPSWRARVAGGQVGVLRANHAFLAVPLGPARAVVGLELEQGARTVAAVVSWGALVVLGLTILSAAVPARRHRSSAQCKQL